MSIKWLWRIVSLLACLQAGAAETLTLRTASQEASSPKFVLLPNRQVGGLCVDVMRGLEKLDVGLRFSGEQQLYPLPRLERMLEDGQLDVICGLAYNDARAIKFQFVEPALYQANYGFAIRRNDAFRPSDWASLPKRGADNIVLVVAGSGIIERLKRMPDLALDATGMTPRHNLAKLINHRGRWFYYRLNGLQEEIARAGLDDQLEVVPAVIDSFAFKLALSKSLPPSALQRLQDDLRKLQSSGELAAILARWRP